jgi:hypothetical protein
MDKTEGSVHGMEYETHWIVCNCPYLRGTVPTYEAKFALFAPEQTNHFVSDVPLAF